MTVLDRAPVTGDAGRVGSCPGAARKGSGGHLRSRLGSGQLCRVASRVASRVRCGWPPGSRRGS
jgi:hypothetical protein